MAIQAEQTTRVQLELPEKSMNRLRTLKMRTEAISYSEVLKNALKLYEALIDEKEAGGVVSVKTQDGNECKIIF